jgi:hypothetical protein
LVELIALVKIALVKMTNGSNTHINVLFKIARAVHAHDEDAKVRRATYDIISDIITRRGEMGLERPTLEELLRNQDNVRAAFGYDSKTVLIDKIIAWADSRVAGQQVDAVIKKEEAEAKDGNVDDDDAMSDAAPPAYMTRSAAARMQQQLFLKGNSEKRNDDNNTKTINRKKTHKRYHHQQQQSQQQPRVSSSSTTTSSSIPSPWAGGRNSNPNLKSANHGIVNPIVDSNFNIRSQEEVIPLFTDVVVPPGTVRLRIMFFANKTF